MIDGSAMSYEGHREDVDMFRQERSHSLKLALGSVVAEAVILPPDLFTSSIQLGLLIAAGGFAGSAAISEVKRRLPLRRVNQIAL